MKRDKQGSFAMKWLCGQPGTGKISWVQKCLSPAFIKSNITIIPDITTVISNITIGLHRWLHGKESTCQCRRRGFDSWVGRVPWRKKCQSTPAFLLGQWSLVGYSPWGHKRVRLDLATKQTLQLSAWLHWSIFWNFSPNKNFSPLISIFMKKKQVYTSTVVILHFLIKKIHLLKKNWTTNIKISFKVVLVKFILLDFIFM